MSMHIAFVIWPYRHSFPHMCLRMRVYNYGYVTFLQNENMTLI
jgi:hypothetical protein